MEGEVQAVEATLTTKETLEEEEATMETIGTPTPIEIPIGILALVVPRPLKRSIYLPLIPKERQSMQPTLQLLTTSVSSSKETIPMAMIVPSPWKMLHSWISLLKNQTA